MRVTIIANPTSSHQAAHQQALAEGLKAHGIESVCTSRIRSDTKYVACWGWRVGKQLRQMGHEVLVIERAYLGDRFAWTSLAWNGLNGYGDFGEQPDDAGRRFADNFSMQPWRHEEGEHVLILGQVPGDASLQGKNLMPWYEAVAVLAESAYDKPVLFRPHPNVARKGITQNPRHCGKSFGTLDEALATAHVAITFNSNSAVDAVIAGVPTLAMDPGSMAYPVVGKKVGDRFTPDRGEWAAALAWKQWRIEEIASGAALDALLKVAKP